ncbi:hypothetical protein [Streptomyces narbonensis]|nr:hypothetical protein [Streptomyces narbonensis]
MSALYEDGTPPGEGPLGTLIGSSARTAMRTMHRTESKKAPP